MSFTNLYAKTDAPNGEPLLRDRDMILAYLEDLARRKIPVKLWCKEQDRVALGAQVLQVEEGADRFLLRLQRALPSDLAARQKLTMVFPLAGCRLLGLVRFLERGGYLEAYGSIPEAVRHAEQRGKLRTRFSAKDKATVTVLEGLTDQRGATGSLVDLSMAGLCLRLDRAVLVQDNYPLAITPALFPAGTRFPIIRIDQLPFAPVVTCSGRVAHVREDEDGKKVFLGIALDPLGDMEGMVLNQVLGRRLPSFNQGFPVRQRLSQEALSASADGDGPGRATADEWQEEEEEEREAPEGDTAQARAPEAPEIEAERLRLNKRKRLKRILLIMFDDLDRAILSSTLKVDGYEKVHEAHTLLEAVAHFRVFDLDAVIIEPQLGALTAQEFLTRLRKQGLCQDQPVVLLAPDVDVRVKIMAKAAGITHIQPIPVDYDGQFRDTLHGLLQLV